MPSLRRIDERVVDVLARVLALAHVHLHDAARRVVLDDDGGVARSPAAEKEDVGGCGVARRKHLRIRIEYPAMAAHLGGPPPAPSISALCDLVL